MEHPCVFQDVRKAGTGLAAAESVNVRMERSATTSVGLAPAQPAGGASTARRLVEGHSSVGVKRPHSLAAGNKLGGRWVEGHCSGGMKLP